MNRIERIAEGIIANMKQYREALEIAMELMEEPQQEPTSALKEGGAQAGIPFGPQMARFVKWANRKLGI